MAALAEATPGLRAHDCELSLRIGVTTTGAGPPDAVLTPVDRFAEVLHGLRYRREDRRRRTTVSSLLRRECQPSREKHRDCPNL